MPLTTSLIDQICADFAQYDFKKGHDFYWSSSLGTIFYRDTQEPQHVWSLLHEIAHAQLGHHNYALDVELVHQEMRAWDYAAHSLASVYSVVIADDFIQDHLDTYREWLHSRSTCPECGQTGLQTQNTYSCINCRCLWRANEARLCELRRTRLQDQSPHA